MGDRRVVGRMMGSSSPVKSITSQGLLGKLPGVTVVAESSSCVRSITSVVATVPMEVPIGLAVVDAAGVAGEVTAGVWT